MSNGDWTRDEVEATVADYFVMLGAELRGENFGQPDKVVLTPEVLELPYPAWANQRAQ